MMRSAFILSAAFFIAASPAVASRASEAIRTQALNTWGGGNYKGAMWLAHKYRKDFGSDLGMDYVLGTSACRVHGYRTWGLKYLQSVAREKQHLLKPRQKKVLNSEIENCTPAWSAASVNAYKGGYRIEDYSYFVGTTGAPWNPPGTGSETFSPTEAWADALSAAKSGEALLAEAEALPAVDEAGEAIDPTW